MKEYARKITKEYLIKVGITNVDENCNVYKNNKKVVFLTNNQGYKYVAVKKLDKDGNFIKRPSKYKYVRKDGSIKYRDSYVYECECLTLQRIMWAWFNNEVPLGYVVDHINNKHDEQSDYVLSNLQLLTARENVLKEREPGTYIPNMAKKKVYTLEYVMSKLNKYKDLYEELRLKNKQETNKLIKKKITKEMHSIRTLISQWRRRKELIFGYDE